MKAALMRANKLMTILSAIIIGLGIIGLVPAYVALGFPVGYITSRLVLKKFVGQLDYLSPLQLPSSNFAFNMLVYALLFAAMGRLNVYAMLSAFVGLIGYRKLFFIYVQRN